MPIDNATPEGPDAKAKRELGFLVSFYNSDDSHSTFGRIADFFNYLADHIEYKRFRFSGDKDLLRSFETVSLMLLEQVESYPESIKSKVKDLLNTNDLSTTISVLANLDERDSRRLKIWSNDIFTLGGWLMASSPYKAFARITPDKLFAVKLDLQRLAQTAKYAASSEPVDYGLGSAALREHYDPERINKHTVLALVSLLRGECARLEPGAVKTALEERVNNLETELRRKRPQWGRIIVTAMMILGTLADLKTLNPNIYSAAYNYAHEIIAVIHTTGTAHIPSMPNLPEAPRPDFMPALLPPKLREQDSEIDDAESA